MFTIDPERCKGCGLCVSVCPKKVLAMSETRMNARGYHPAELADAESCISCALCALICPDVAISIREEASGQ